MRTWGNFILFVGIIMGVVAIPPAHALVSFQTTGSGGVYRDLKGNLHGPAQFSWTFQGTTDQDIETFIDLGADNQIIRGDWRFNLYQAYVSVPVKPALLSTGAQRRSRVQLGRQLLTEGFELSTMDGVQLPYYFKPNTGVWLFGGSSSALESPETDFKSWAFGGSAFTKFYGFIPRVGVLAKSREKQHLTLGHASLSRSFDELPWTPTLLAKGQWDLDHQWLDQSVAELTVTPHEAWMISADYTDRKPNALDVAGVPYIYQLFAISSQKAIGSGVTWFMSPELRAEGRFHRMKYNSVARIESADQEELDLHYQQGPQSWVPSFLRINSYGGTAIQGGLKTLRSFGQYWEGRAEAYGVRVDKINGMKGWAYQGRAGLSFRMGSRFLVLALGEFERNHYFSLDAKAIGYVSYFFY